MCLHQLLAGIQALLRPACHRVARKIGFDWSGLRIQSFSNNTATEIAVRDYAFEFRVSIGDYRHRANVRISKNLRDGLSRVTGTTTYRMVSHYVLNSHATPLIYLIFD